MDKEQLEILKSIYFGIGRNPRDQVKEKYGIENLRKKEREYIKNLIIHYEELKQAYDVLKEARDKENGEYWHNTQRKDEPFV